MMLFLSASLLFSLFAPDPFGLEDGKWHLVFFHKTHCGLCSSYAQIRRRIQMIFDTLPVDYVDCLQFSSFCKRRGIFGVPQLRLIHQIGPDIVLDPTSPPEVLAGQIRFFTNISANSSMVFPNILKSSQITSEIAQNKCVAVAAVSGALPCKVYRVFDYLSQNTEFSPFYIDLLKPTNFNKPDGFYIYFWDLHDFLNITTSSASQILERTIKHCFGSIRTQLAEYVFMKDRPKLWTQLSDIDSFTESLSIKSESELVSIIVSIRKMVLVDPRLRIRLLAAQLSLDRLRSADGIAQTEMDESSGSNFSMFMS